MTLPSLRSRPWLARRWEPFPDIEELYDQFDRFMERMAGTSPYTTTIADIEETDDAFVVDVDLPGVKREDVDVEVRENQLRVSGELRERERTGRLRRQNRPVGRFDYTVSLPGEVNPDQVEASLADGVLTVRLGKAAETRPRRVEIKGT